jgi:hypothetical protein
MVWHIVVAPLVVVAPCQHVAHDPPKTCYRLVYHQKILTQILKEGIENGIHQPLECGRCICKAKRHDQKFIMAFMSSECCFWDIFFLHSDLMIP